MRHIFSDLFLGHKYYLLLIVADTKYDTMSKGVRRGCGKPDVLVHGGGGAKNGVGLGMSRPQDTTSLGVSKSRPQDTGS